MTSEQLGTVILAILGCTGFWQLVMLVVQHLLNKRSMEHKAMLGLLHDRVYVLCERYIDRGFITTEEYKNLLMLYEPYKGLGGNGTAKMLMEEVEDLPKKTGRGKT